MALNFEKRSVAFCFVDKDNKIERCGGILGTYGLEDLQEGQVADNVFPFIEEMSQGARQSRLMRHVAIKPGIFADVHLIFDDDGLWIVLADATDEVDRLTLMQQRGNEANLLREKIHQLNLQLEAANSIIEKLQDDLRKITRDD
jgi:hypothetical protein